MAVKKPKGEDALWSKPKVTPGKPVKKAAAKPPMKVGMSGKGAARTTEVATPLERAMRKNYERAANGVQGKPGAQKRVAAKKATMTRRGK